MAPLENTGVNTGVAETRPIDSLMRALLYVAQQIGRPVSEADVRRLAALPDSGLDEAGFLTVEKIDRMGSTTYRDIGAVVYFLKAAPWAIFGIFLIVFMYVMPHGIVGFLRLAWIRMTRPAVTGRKAAGEARS